MDRFASVYTAKMGEDGKGPFNGTVPPAVPMFPGYPWNPYCGDLDLTGFLKPASYYRLAATAFMQLYAYYGLKSSIGCFHGLIAGSFFACASGGIASPNRW
jgi:hypothetical protein